MSCLDDVMIWSTSKQCNDKDISSGSSIQEAWMG